MGSLSSKDDYGTERKLHLKILILFKRDYFVIFPPCPFYIVTEYSKKERNDVEVNLRMKELLLCVQVVALSLFGTLRERSVLKCVPHVRHDYLSSFNQSDHLFLALPLTLPW